VRKEENGGGKGWSQRVRSRSHQVLESLEGFRHLQRW
jgi:hypothetical protein